MFNLAEFNAIIFDLDGLVLDTETGFIQAWKQTAQHLQLPIPANFWQYLSGLNASKVMQQLLQLNLVEFDLTKFQQLSADFWRQNVQQQGLPIKTGFQELLALIQQLQIPYALATNSPMKNANECLQLAGLETAFEVIISAEQVEHPKPAADVFLQAAQQLNTPIEHCLILEDSLVGIQAAQTAGGIAVLIPSVYPICSELITLSPYICADLSEITKIIQPNLP